MCLRLRTQQRFVQLAEHKLEEKKAHCEFNAFLTGHQSNLFADEQVVLAFKKALELLAR